MPVCAIRNIFWRGKETITIHNFLALYSPLTLLQFGFGEFGIGFLMLKMENSEYSVLSETKQKVSKIRR